MGKLLSALNVPCEVILYAAGAGGRGERQNKKTEPEKVDKRDEETKRDELRQKALKLHGF
jgi:hypothetical protein